MKNWPMTYGPTAIATEEGTRAAINATSTFDVSLGTIIAIFGLLIGAGQYYINFKRSKREERREKRELDMLELHRRINEGEKRRSTDKLEIK